MSDDLPISVKILLFFKDRGEVSESEVFRGLQGQGNIRKALDTLVDKSILQKKEEIYTKGPHFESTQKTIQEVCEQVRQLDKERERRLDRDQETRDWIIRGPLIVIFLAFYKEVLEILYKSTQIRMFLPLNLIYEVLPFEEVEVEEFLIRESKRGLIDFTRVLGLGIPPSHSFSRSPARFYRNLETFSLECAQEIYQIKRSWRGRGSQTYEEDFLLGLYPREVLDKAQDYLSSRGQLTKVIMERLSYNRLYKIFCFCNYIF